MNRDILTLCKVMAGVSDGMTITGHNDSAKYMKVSRDIMTLSKYYDSERQQNQDVISLQGIGRYIRTGVALLELVIT